MLLRILRSPPVWISLIVVLAASILPLYVSGYILGLLTVAYYFGVFSMAWDLLFGFAGEVNFGPTALIGLGPYGAAMLNSMAGMPIPVCLIFGALLAVAGGALLALPALRLTGPYFGLVTCRGAAAAEFHRHFRRLHRRRNRYDRAERAVHRCWHEL